MNLEKEKEKKYIKDVFDIIGTWDGKVEEKFFKNGEEVSAADQYKYDNISQQTVYYEKNKKKYEIKSNGDDTILIEYGDNEEVIEKFVISQDMLLDLLGLN